MRTLNIFIFAAVLPACSSQHQQKFDYNRSENPWIDAFKDRAFISCLRESYKNDTIFMYIEKEDAFNPYDGLSTRAQRVAQENGITIALNIPPPAMCDGCSESQNYYMATCLHYYKSKDLDSIANAEYKLHLKDQ